MAKPSIYMAGPVSRAEDKGKGWRQAVRTNWPEKATWYDPTEVISYDRAQEMDPEEVVRNDKAMIRDCDAVLVGLTSVASVGTWREVEYAKSHEMIPVAIWLDPSNTNSRLTDEDTNLNLWIKEAGFVSPIFTECLDHLTEQWKWENE